MWQPCRPLLDGFLQLSIGDASVAQNKTLDEPWLGLLRNAIAPTLNSDTSAIVGNEANYPGYARVQINFNVGPFVGEGAYSLVADGAHLFQPTGSDSPNTIFGQFLLGNDSTTLLAVELFDVPISLSGPEAGFLDAPVIGMGNNAAGYGSSILTG